MNTRTQTRPLPQQQINLRIGGAFEAGRGAPIPVYNPATREQIAEVRSADLEQVRRAVASTREAFDRNELGTAAERAACISRLADLMEERTDEILETIIAEVGTPVSTARNLHIETPIRMLRWLAEATLVDRTEHLGVDLGPPANEAKVIQRPIGVVAAIAAYNYPLMFAAMKVGSAFAAGCPSVLLSSPNSPLAILNFAEWLDEAGFPARSVAVLTGGVDVAQELIASPDIAKVTFTGSVPAGTAVMTSAAKGLRGVVLELGGKSAAIILPTADLAEVVGPIHTRYLRNAGQGCASTTRILVPREHLDEFLEASRTFYDTVAVGDPWDPSTLVGPVISEQHRAHVQKYIDDAVEDGGFVVAQGNLPESEEGWYVRPTLIGGLPNDAQINQEEIFGPVATVLPYDDVNDAIIIANASEFGLHAGIYGPIEDAMNVAEHLDVGLVTINGGGPTRTDAPNGGWKASGVGRERGEAGIREFLEAVTIQWPTNG